MSAGQYVDREWLTDCRPTCLSKGIPPILHIGPVSRDMSVDISVECRSTSRPRCVARYIGRHRSICRLPLDRFVGRYVDREWLSDCRPTCRSIGIPPILHCYLRIGDCRHYLSCGFVTSAAQISLIPSPLLRGFFVYYPAKSIAQHRTKSQSNSIEPQSAGFLLVQSLNSPFFPPHIGTEPERAKEEFRITCMRMLRTNQSKITTLLASMCRAMPFSARALRENIFFDVDIVVKT